MLIMTAISQTRWDTEYLILRTVLHVKVVEIDEEDGEVNDREAMLKDFIHCYICTQLWHIA